MLTVRSGEETDFLTSLWKDERLRRIHVGPLGEADLAAGLAVGGGPLDGASLKAVVEASDGNVMLLRELVHGALESGTLTADLGLWRLNGSLAHSPRLRKCIQQRLRDLDPSERVGARTLIALGDPLPLTLLERLVPLRAIEQLEARGLLDVPAANGDPSSD